GAPPAGAGEVDRTGEDAVAGHGPTVPTVPGCDANPGRGATPADSRRSGPGCEDAAVILVDAAGVAMSRPGKPLFADLSVTVSSGDRLAVVGINGCGKSTLLQVLSGAREPEAGTVRRGRGTRVSVLDQDAPLPAGTVAEVV